MKEARLVMKRVDNELRTFVDGREVRLVPGPIRRSELPDDQLQVVRWVFKRLPASLRARGFEQFELGFLRDSNPEAEIATWLRIILASQDARLDSARADISEDQLFGALIAVSTGATDGNLGVDSLTAVRLRSCYKEVEIPLCLPM